METTLQITRISRLLGYSAKRKVLQAGPLFLRRAHTLCGPSELWRAAVDILRPRFPSASAQEVDVLAFYLVAKVAVTHSKDVSSRVAIGGLQDLLEGLKGKLDGMNEMSEMTSLRLQMTMDRRSKFISTLSQMMKKISTTQDVLVQNIK